MGREREIPELPDWEELPEEYVLIHRMFKDLERRFVAVEDALVASGSGCPSNFPDMCKAIRETFREWQDWGRKVKWDIERLEKAVCNIEAHLMGNRPIEPGVICDAQGNPHEIPTGPGKTDDPPDPPFGGG